MLMPSLIVALVALIGRAESRFGMQLFLEEPIILCPLTGLLLGDLGTGLAIGATLQLVFLGNMGIGAATPSDQVLGSVIATAVPILSGQDLAIGVALSLPVASFGQALTIFCRTTFNEFFLRKADQSAEKGDDVGITRAHISAGIVYCVLTAFIPAFVAVYAGTPVIESLVAMIPEKVISGLTAASKLMPALGFAILYNQMATKKNIVYFILGFAVVAYLKVDVLFIAVIACCVAYLVNALTTKVE